MALAEVDPPLPTVDEALIRVAAVSVNRGELDLLAHRPAGWRPGQDVAGVIERAAADGSGPVVGQRIVGLVEEAGWAELVAVRTDRMTTLPDQVGFDVATTVPIAGLTALRTLRLGGDLAGRNVLVTAANGAVGSFQVELAARAGATVTALARRGHDRLKTIGARTVVDHLPLDARYGLIMESVGGAVLAQALAVSEPGADIVLFGTSSGVKTPVDVYDFVGHEGARLINYRSYAADPACAKDLHHLVDLLSRGALHPTTPRRDPGSTPPTPSVSSEPAAPTAKSCFG